ncbi:MAG: amylo-alpha-1,6-glucosidase [Cyanobacteria bacterium P01_C01_bin.73]
MSLQFGSGQFGSGQFGRDICGDLTQAESREWLVTNGIGGYACGTIAGVLTRHYHGLLIAALKPPLSRTLLVAKLDETVYYGQQSFLLNCDRWSDGTLTGQGHKLLERFYLEGTIPVWVYAYGDALLEKRIWMQTGANTTYCRYTVRRASEPLTLRLKALVNYRSHHHSTQADGWRMGIDNITNGVRIAAFEDAAPFYIFNPSGSSIAASIWYRDYGLAIERYRGIPPLDDHLHGATLQTTISPGESFTVVLSTEAAPNLDGEAALAERKAADRQLVQQWRSADYLQTDSATPDWPPDWLEQLVLAADQFIVDRTLPDEADGKTIIAGYPWFGDWGRDTMISLPGLAIATGRPAVARPILRTFTRYLDQGMLPNLFPEAGATPEYNTVDAVLWLFEAFRAYIDATSDTDLLAELFPALESAIDWHQKGTRYSIHLDNDGLIYAGEPGVQLTWMDAKVGDWVVTPRIGKPIEVNALWVNALQIMVAFARQLGKPTETYKSMMDRAKKGFQRFWNPALGYCYDVLDSPDGDDAALRPNQIFAVALPGVGESGLLTSAQQKAIVDVVAGQLLTSHGLRSLAPSDPNYVGTYGGDPLKRDGAYHQGTTWGWLLGPFVQAHYRVYGDSAIARSFLEPMADHLRAGCVGTLSEIFDGDAPMTPRGAFAQAWTVAEVLRAWQLVQE